MHSTALYLLALLLFTSPLAAQSAGKPRTPIDSVVLIRTPVPGWACPRCPPSHVVLRRDALPAKTLLRFGRKADRVGFYMLPADVMGAPFCRVVRSDDLMATLSIFHADGQWSVRGYHHCAQRSREQSGLLALEALVDSLVGPPPGRPVQHQ